MRKKNLTDSALPLLDYTEIQLILHLILKGLCIYLFLVGFFTFLRSISMKVEYMKITVSGSKVHRI